MYILMKAVILDVAAAVSIAPWKNTVSIIGLKAEVWVVTPWIGRKRLSLPNHGGLWHRPEPPANGSVKS